MLFGQLLFFISYLSNKINVFIYSEDSYISYPHLSTKTLDENAILELREFLQNLWLRTAEAAQCLDCDANRAPWIEMDRSRRSLHGAGWIWMVLFYTKWCWMSEKKGTKNGLVINPISLEAHGVSRCSSISNQ